MGVFEGQTAVITGSTSGIGLGLAKGMAQAGANIVLNGLGDPAEIEEAFLQHPSVRDIAVIGIPDEQWGERLAAVAVTDGAFDAEEVVEWGKERLSAYKVPKQWHQVDELPRNPTGKVLKRELRQRFAES